MQVMALINPDGSMPTQRTHIHRTEIVTLTTMSHSPQECSTKFLEFGIPKNKIISYSYFSKTEQFVLSMQKCTKVTQIEL